MKPARVLYLNPTAQMGGAEYSLLDLAASLDRTRFSPVLACLGEGPLVTEATAAGIEVVSLSLPDRVGELSLKGQRSSAGGLAVAAVSAAPTMLKLRRLAARAQIVHTNGNKAHVLGGMASRSARLIWHVRDFWRTGRFERAMGRLSNRRASAVIGNSTAVGDHLLTMGVARDLVHVVPNGIDGDRFTPDGPAAPLRTEFGWPVDAPLVGIIGMLTRWKGQDVFLRAFAEVLRAQPNARAVIAGDEIYVTRGQTGFAHELRQLVRELRMEHAVAFIGYRRDVPAVLRALDVVVHASVEPEPFGRVVGEAMACARPVVATGAGGVPEVTGRDTALLVQPGDVSAMSRAIQKLLGDDVDASRRGAAGRERILRSFPVAAHVERVQMLYDRVLSSR